MLPAQPPKSRRNVGTRNDTFRMRSCSGRIWSANRPSKVMMVSNASDPQINCRHGPLQFKKSGVKSQKPIAGDARCALLQAQLHPAPLQLAPAASRSGAPSSTAVNTPHHGLLARIDQRPAPTPAWPPRWQRCSSPSPAAHTPVHHRASVRRRRHRLPRQRFAAARNHALQGLTQALQHGTAAVDRPRPANRAVAPPAVPEVPTAQETRWPAGRAPAACARRPHGARRGRKSKSGGLGSDALAPRQAPEQAHAAPCCRMSLRPQGGLREAFLQGRRGVVGRRFGGLHLGQGCACINPCRLGVQAAAQQRRAPKDRAPRARPGSVRAPAPVHALTKGIRREHIDLKPGIWRLRLLGRRHQIRANAISTRAALQAGRVSVALAPQQALRPRVATAPARQARTTKAPAGPHRQPPTGSHYHQKPACIVRSAPSHPRHATGRQRP